LVSIDIPLLRSEELVRILEEKVRARDIGPQSDALTVIFDTRLGCPYLFTLKSLEDHSLN
jgi:hypothetical protein